MARYGQYGCIAVEVARHFLSSADTISNPSDEWDSITKIRYPSLYANDNDCPKRAFLGLCNTGLVKGINSGHYTASVSNKKYAIEAVNFLKNNPALANIATPAKLWDYVLAYLRIGKKKHNQQMNVVLALWDNGYIQ